MLRCLVNGHHESEIIVFAKAKKVSAEMATFMTNVPCQINLHNPPLIVSGIANRTRVI